MGPARAKQNLDCLVAVGLGPGFRPGAFILAVSFPHSVAWRSCFASMGLSFLTCRVEVIIVCLLFRTMLGMWMVILLLLVLVLLSLNANQY